MKKSLCRGFIAFTSLAALASCQDYDGGFSLDQIKKASYAKDFEKTFGTPDPNQDWSMATQLKAVVSCSYNGLVEIYNKDPRESGALLLAKATVENGEAVVEFDAIKSIESVYARVKKSDCYYPVKGTFAVVNGKVNIGTAVTRAAFEPKTGVSDVVVGEATTYTSKMLNWEKSSEFTWTTTPYSNFDHWIDGYYMQTTGGGTGQPVNFNANYYSEQTVANIYPLYNVIKNNEGRPEWTQDYIAHYFYKVNDDEAVFAESEDHIGYMKPGSTPQFSKNVIYTMAENGPVTFDYFHKGTEFDNKFGYFYFTGDVPTASQFKSMKKYILVDNMTTSTGKITANASGDKVDWDLIQFQSWGSWQNKGNYNGMYESASSSDKVRGTRLQLTYFDGGTPSYDFPKGTKIAFFMIGEGQQRDMILTSIASLNAEMYDDCPRAATFKYKNDIIFAMEDQYMGGDGDVNDVMFIANGEFEETENIPEIVETPEPESQTWVVACEDLGGTFDYDFNDLVFGLRKTQLEDISKSKLELIPLAAGGTLEAHILYDGVDKGEIHALLGGTNSSSIINANAGSSPSPGAAVTLDSNLSSTVSINDLATNKISVKVKTDDASNVFLTKGDSYNGNSAPQMILFQSGWDWPSEGVDIRDAYPDFAGWVTNSAKVNWYENLDTNYGFVNCPFSKAVPTPSEAEDNFVTPPAQPAVAGLTEYTSSDLTNWALPASSFTSNTEVLVSVFVSESTYIQGVVGYNYHAYSSTDGAVYSFTYNNSSNPTLSDLKAKGLTQNANIDKITKIVVQNK